MPLHYNLYPVQSFGAGSAIPLAQEPGTIGPGTSAAPTRAAFPFSDITGFGPIITRVGPDSYLVVEARIMTFDEPTGVVTPLEVSDVQNGSVRIGVTQRGSSPQFFDPQNVGTTRQTPEVVNDPLETPDWLNIGSPAIGAFLVEFEGSVFRIHIATSNSWNDGQIENFNLELHVENRLSREFRIVFTAVDTTSNAAALPDEAFQPWVHIPPALDFGKVNETTGTKAATVVNFGTKDAIISGSFDQAQRFALNANGTVSNGETLPAGQSRTLGFRPDLGSATAGNARAKFTLTSDPRSVAGSAEHNHEVALSVDVGALEVALVLDGSGSMAWSATGSSFSPPVGQRRWDRLRDAAEGFLNQLVVLANDGKANIKVAAVVFPKVTAPPSSVGTDVLLNGLQTLDDTYVTSFRNLLDGPTLQPRGSTPMGEGLLRGVGLFTPDPTNENEQAVIIISDGASNVGTPPTAAMLGTVEQTLAVMYGTDPGTTNRNILSAVVGANDVINSLAQPNLSDQLSSAMSKVAARLVGQSGMEDPPGVVTSAAPVAVHDFTVSELNRDATVWVDWQTLDGSRLQVELVSPRCDLISPRRLPEGVQYRAGRGHALYYLGERYLQGSTGPNDQRLGTWRLVVRLNQGGEGEGNGEGPLLVRRTHGEHDQEQYNYNVFSDARMALEVELGVQQGGMATGDTFSTQALLSVNGIPVQSAAPTLQVQRPVSSREQFLASNSVSLDTFERVRRELEEQGVTDFWAVKSLALAAEGKTFNDGFESVSVAMLETSPGVYKPSQAIVARTPGTYKVKVIARGEVRAGVPFRREFEQDVTVRARIAAVRTTLDVQHNLKQSTALICVRPRDELGNPVLFDPSLLSLFHLRFRDAEAQGALQVQLDGSYCQTIKLTPKSQPVVDLIVDDKVVSSRAIPVPQGLLWADRVFEHCPGDDVKANKHADAKALLGPLKDKGAFLSLGARGSVTVGLSEQRGRPKEVTVFVVPERDLRGYLVEARVRRGGHHVARERWVELGRSEGTTQTFSFGPAGDDATPVVRITDLSGRSLRRPGEPLTTPGVSVTAVGFKKSRHEK